MAGALPPNMQQSEQAEDLEQEYSSGELDTGEETLLLKDIGLLHHRDEHRTGSCSTHVIPHAHMASIALYGNQWNQTA
jgi:hypothetical protein